MILYATTVFLSAFLLFLVQPILAKYILPWFGGSPGVWTTCLLFFQVLLTAGYGFSHLLAGKLAPRRQAFIILGLLALTIAFLPITPSKAHVPETLSAPTWTIIRLLAASVGLCYFLLASISPLMQSWFSHSQDSSSPYRLYTLSNLGSLLAIVGYPLLIEPNAGLGFQTMLWSGLYLVFAVFILLCALRQWKSPSSPQSGIRSVIQAADTTPTGSPSWTDRLMWLGASVLSATMLMATTNQLCQDVAVVPLLWLLPMGLYLLSYILCFQSERLYSRTGFGIALVVALGQTCWLLDKGIYVELPLQILSYSFTLFICCMIGNGELVRLKPAPRHLTSFYLMMSAGGALGGIFVSLIAPHIFAGYWEFHIGLVGTALFFLIVLFRGQAGRLYSGHPRWAWALLGLGLAALITALGSQIQGVLKNTIAMKRNFFGTLKIMDENPMNPLEHRIVMMHGRIEHGYQFRVPDKRYWPTSYFGPNSGAGIAIRFHPRRLDPAQRHLRIGIVGLGTGTLAAYGEEGDYLRFYEINPDVIQLCDKYFSYRKDTAAKVDIVPGDARISMEREIGRQQPGNYDVLAIDAFSSDAIPIHLLTRECYLDYWRHLKKDGILALHISSRYFNLGPVIRSLAELDKESGMQALLIEDPGSSIRETDATRWILITANREFLANPDVKRSVTPWKEEDAPGLLFTDDYSNLFHLLQ
jgi:MFS family permease/SAM-dependent methyltransferase